MLVDTIDPWKFNEWLHKPERCGSHVDNASSLAVHVGPYLKKTSPLSIYSKDVFWHDFLRSFPYAIDWVIESLRTKNEREATSFKRDKSRMYKTLESLRRHTVHHRSRKDRVSLVDLIEDSAKAPILFFLLTDAKQSDVDWLFTMLSEMTGNNNFDDKESEAVLKRLDVASWKEMLSWKEKAVCSDEQAYDIKSPSMDRPPVDSPSSSPRNTSEIPSFFSDEENRRHFAEDFEMEHTPSVRRSDVSDDADSSI